MRHIKIVFEKEVIREKPLIVKADGVACCVSSEKFITCETEKTVAVIPFNDLNTMYDNGMSYVANFERFIRESFECGFIFLDDGYAIPVFKVLAFMKGEESETDKSIKEMDKMTGMQVIEKLRENDRGVPPLPQPPPPRIIKESESCPNNRKPNRHGKWKSFRRMKNNGHNNQNGQVPIAPTNSSTINPPTTNIQSSFPPDPIPPPRPTYT